MSGSAMILTLWITFSLVCAVLGFSSAVVLENREEADAVAAFQSEQALRGAQAYLGAVLGTVGPGKLPSSADLPEKEFILGDTTFRMIRTPASSSASAPEYGVEAEAGRFNLNKVPLETLQKLSCLTQEQAAAIVDWRDTDEEPGAGGAESETYLRLDPSRLCKNADFESVNELTMVYGMTNDALYGRDRNLNGVVDASEKSSTAPTNAGLLRLATAFSKSSGPGPDGSAQVSVNSSGLRQALQSHLEASSADAVLAKIRPGRDRFSSLLDFYLRSGLDATAFAQVEPYLTAVDDKAPPPVNVNSAPQEVLEVLPGLDDGGAASLVAWRSANRDNLSSITWILQALSQDKALLAAPYLTVNAWQIRADVAATGPNNRGFRRRLFVFDTSDGTPRVSYSRDITGLGWPELQAAQASRPSVQYLR